MQNRFTDPATGTVYDWHTNHTDEQETGKTRNIQRSAPTGNVGLVKQQGDDGPMLLRFTGSITTRQQFQAFWAWYALSGAQTIYFRDFDGQEAEVQITVFTPQRHRKLRSRNRAGELMDHYWTYTMEMEIYRFISGDMATAGVTP